MEHIETRSLESRLAIAMDHAYLLVLLIGQDHPEYRPEYMRKIKRELGVLIDEADSAGLIPDDEE